MIVEKQTEANVLSEGQDVADSIKTSLDMESASLLMQMLSKDLYADSIGSTIRETASNALDSHRKAKVDKPIIVTFLATKDYNYEFTVEDFGVGLDDDDVRNIISKYGKSSKRESATELGMFGLGFKAPLSYTSSFIFIARKGGIERKYMMYEGEDVNTIDLLYEQPTDKGNGVKVIIPVSSSDRVTFSEKIKEQLCYFEDVYFNVTDYKRGYYDVTKPLPNSFHILRSEHFQISEMCGDRNMHICLDNVYYPISWENLGIPVIEIPIGLRFGLSDGLFPTPNREAIRYTKEAKAAISEKIKKVANFMIAKYNKSVSDTDDIFAAVPQMRSGIRNVKIGSYTFNINNILKYGTVPVLQPKIVGLKLMDYATVSDVINHVMTEYEEVFNISNGTFRKTKDNRYSKAVSVDTVMNTTCYLAEERIPGLMKDYLKSLHRDRASFIRKTKTLRLRIGLPSYYTILKLNRYPSDKWRIIIEDFQRLQSMVMKKVTNLDDITVPKSFIDNRKRANSFSSKAFLQVKAKVKKVKGDINYKVATDLQRYVDGQKCKFVPEMGRIEKLCMHPNLIIYTTHEDDKKLDQIYELQSSSYSKIGINIKLFTFSNREMKLVEGENIHNLISYNKFMEGNNKPFRRLATSYIISDLKTTYPHIFKSVEIFKSISTPLYDKISKIIAYYDANYIRTDIDVVKAMKDVAEKYNLWDGNIYPEYLELKEIIEKLPFLNDMLSVMSGYQLKDDKLYPHLISLFKHYKYRIDPQHYKQPKKEETPEQETADMEEAAA